jgi:hypothetical protein
LKLEYNIITAPALQLIPFIEYINPVCAGLINTYLPQAICEPVNTYQPNMVLIPNYKEVPITVAGGVSEAIRSIPGRNLFAVFMNMELTHEDGMLMSRSGLRSFRIRLLSRY